MGFFANLDWENWLLGLWVAVIGGGSNSVTAGLGLLVLDPKDFNAQQGRFWALVGGLFLISAVKDFFLYLSQSPAPKIKTKTVATLTTDATGASVATMERTTEKPAKADPQ